MAGHRHPLDEPKTVGATIIVRWPKGKNLEVAEVVAVDDKGVRHKLRVTSVFLGE